MNHLDAAIGSRLEAWTADRVAERLWAKDGSLWAASGKPADEVAAWLGWLDLPEAMSARVAELEHLARDVRADGYRRAAVLGMGGSSLAPELFSRVFGWAGGDAGTGAASADGLEEPYPDSTHPDVVRGFRSWAAEQRTPFRASPRSPAPPPSRTRFRPQWATSCRRSTSLRSPIPARRWGCCACPGFPRHRRRHHRMSADGTRR